MTDLFTHQDNARSVAIDSIAEHIAAGIITRKALNAAASILYGGSNGDEGFRSMVLDLSDGNTGRIFRLIEILAVQAIERGTERILAADLEADDLVLPSVSMKSIARRRGRTSAGMTAT